MGSQVMNRPRWWCCVAVAVALAAGGQATLAQEVLCCIDQGCVIVSSADQCQSAGGTPLPPGVGCEACQPECGPTTDGKSCKDTRCPNPNDKCQPRCINFNPQNGDYRVLECECGGPDSCHIEIVPGALPQCFGACPDGTPCETRTTTLADGTLNICCGCGPDTGQCRPNATKTGCEATTCPDGLPCRPTKIHMGPDGKITVEECDCVEPNLCHIENGPNGPFCVGGCPQSFQICQTTLVQTPGGGFDLSCQCECDPAKCDDGNACTQDFCNPLTGECDHLIIACLDDGDPCTIETCDPATGLCVKVPNPDCQACCFTSGAPCQNLLPGSCIEKGGNPQGPGTNCANVQCPGQGDCQPRPDGRGCLPTECPNPDERCAPKCVTFDPTTGRFRVEKCECVNPDECRVVLSPVTTDPTPCLSPDNGSGTAVFPPPNCLYESLDGHLAIIDGLPAGTTVEIAGRLGSFFDIFVELDPAGERQSWKAVAVLPLKGTGDLSGMNREVQMQMAGKTRTGERPLGEAEQDFQSEMLQLQGQLPPGDPDFDLLRITAGSEFGLPSPGQTTLTQLPGGMWAVDSFFDITYRIDFVGAPGGLLAGRSGSTTGTVRIRTGALVPRCVGVCPPGQDCHRRVVRNSNGTYTICCVCEDRPPQECRPSQDKKHCEATVCPDGRPCRPTRVHVSADGNVTVEACDCIDPEKDCHLENGPNGFFCAGACPNPDQQCRRMEEPDGNGGFFLSCRCQCDPALCDDGNPCTKDYCDPQTGECRHDPVICDDGNLCTEDRCDPQTGQCVYVPKNCDDNNPCTIDKCDPATGECVHTPKDCDDHDPCTIDFCDQLTGECRHERNPECEACCFPSGLPCQNLPAGLCKELGGVPQGPGSNCANVDCHNEPQTPKFQQPVSPEREDIASNINFNAPTLVNKLVSDDFRSDGRPITSVRWWGSYLDPAYIPRPFNPAEPKPMDGWLISFHRPLGPKPLVPRPALGVYFAPVDAVRVGLTTVPACDQHPVFEYAVDLSKCCLVDSNPDVRVPATDPWHCPARPEAFRERYCFRYSISIQAVVGMRWGHAGTAACCVRQPNNNFAEKDFWGWHTTSVERGVRPALESVLGTGPAGPRICELGECPPRPNEFRFGPWTNAKPVCPFDHRVNMAFELWTNVFQVPPPCPRLVLVSATSVKRHGDAGEFGIDLPLANVADAGVEPRRGGPTRIDLKFSVPITADDGSLDAGDEVTVNLGTITSLVISGDMLTVELTDVPNKSCLLLTIEDGPDGITTLGSDPLEGDNDVRCRVLFGDVNGNGRTNVADIGLVKSKSGLPADAASFKMDLNVNGTTNVADVGLVKAASGTELNCP